MSGASLRGITVFITETIKNLNFQDNNQMYYMEIFRIPFIKKLTILL